MIEFGGKRESQTILCCHHDLPLIYIYIYIYTFEPSLKHPSCLAILKSCDTTKPFVDIIYAPLPGLSTQAKELIH